MQFDEIEKECKHWGLYHCLCSEVRNENETHCVVFAGKPRLARELGQKKTPSLHAVDSKFDLPKEGGTNRSPTEPVRHEPSKPPPSSPPSSPTLEPHNNTSTDTPPALSHPISLTLGSLLPHTPNPQQTAHCPCQPHDAIIQLSPSKRRARHRDIAQIADKLDLDSIGLALYFLLLDNALTILFGELQAALVQLVEAVERGKDAEGDAGEPGAVALAQEALRRGEFANRGGVQLSCH